MADHGGVDTFIAGFLIGGVIGAGAALLLAPASGKETREYLLKQANVAIDSGKDEFGKVREIIREEVARVVEGGDALKEAFRAGVETFKKRGGEDVPQEAE